MKKKLTKRQLKQRKELRKSIYVVVLLCLLVVGFSMYIYKSNILVPKVDKLTASYISFNNKNTTDMLKIVDIKKMSDNMGQSIINNNYISFEVDGKKNTNYDIIIDSISSKIDDKYIKYSLVTDKKVYINSLDKLNKSEELGKVIYSGFIKDNNKITIRMWIDKSYKGKITNNAYEIKIKPR